MYVALAMCEEAEQASAIIESVTYKMPPQFRPAEVRLTQAPFLIGRVGLENVTISVEIEYRSIFNLENEVFDYQLGFGSQHSQVFKAVEVDAEVLSKMSEAVRVDEVQTN